MKPVTMQLECPYNSSNETKKMPMYVYHRKGNDFSEYQHMCMSTNVLLILYNSAEQHGVLFLELICF